MSKPARSIETRHHEERDAFFAGLRRMSRRSFLRLAGLSAGLVMAKRLVPPHSFQLVEVAGAEKTAPPKYHTTRAHAGAYWSNLRQAGQIGVERRHGRVAWFMALALLPSLQLVPIMRWWSPHYFYLPLAFVAMLLGWYLFLSWQRWEFYRQTNRTDV